MEHKTVTPGAGGDRLTPYAERTGAESTVYFTRELSAAGLLRVYDKVSEGITGRVGVKLHTGEQGGPNIIPRDWVQAFLAARLPEAHILETNTYYAGDRDTTAKHRETLRVNGWIFAPVDIMDESGAALLPVRGGKWFTEMSVGAHLKDYDSLVALTHFKGHVVGGFGGSNKNLGIGCADAHDGKRWIHTVPGSDDQWSITQEEFMERMTESTRAVTDYFAGHITYVNVMRNMSVSCDCEGRAAAPVVTPNVGILASRDILALDQACVDIVFAMQEHEHHDLVERMTSRHGLRQLSYMKELGMGNDRYRILDTDSGDCEIPLAEIVKDLKPFHG